MATTTPNFGWPVPTSSDLVKNGATAIEGLGDAIDASLLDLKGGTTGQVLAKASGTDMDFSWATASSSAMALVKAQTSFSSVANTGSTFDNVFTGSTYYTYLVTLDGIFAATTSDDLQIQFFASNVIQTTGYYGSCFESPPTGTTLTITGSNNASQLTLNSVCGDDATSFTSGYFYISNVAATGKPMLNGQSFSPTTANATFFAGQSSPTITCTGFRLKSSSTNITGKVTVYGLVKA